MDRKSVYRPLHDEILNLIDQGRNCPQIADQLQLPVHGLRKYLNINGIRVSRRLSRKIDDFALRKLVTAGVTQAHIAEQLGASPSCVLRRCKALGLQTARTGPRAGDGHPEWKAGRVIDKNGYIEIYAPLHPYARRKGIYAFEHRLVMEVVLGRYLLPGEVVHHKDHVTFHNWPDNLQLFASSGDHSRHHRLAGRTSSRKSSESCGPPNNRTTVRLPSPDETLAQCPSGIRQLLERHIDAHRPTTQHAHLPKRMYLRQGPHLPVFQSMSKD